MTKPRPTKPAKARGKKGSGQTRQAAARTAAAVVVAGKRRRSSAVAPVAKFDEVLELSEAARQRAYQSVNAELVALYWRVGEYISNKIESAEWGDGVVDELAATIAHQYPGMRGYTRRNLFRMRQFVEAYGVRRKCQRC